MKKKVKKKIKTKKDKSIKSLNNEIKESKDKYVRLYSEFENYRRRTSKEKIDMIESANKDLLKDILPIVDDFERAINSIDKNKKEEFEGFNLINQKLISTLEKK